MFSERERKGAALETSEGGKKVAIIFIIAESKRRQTGEGGGRERDCMNFL